MALYLWIMDYPCDGQRQGFPLRSLPALLASAGAKSPWCPAAVAGRRPLHDLQLAQVQAEPFLGFSIKVFAHIAGKMIMADPMVGLEGFALAGFADLSA